jgi:hypothetical protein
MSTCWGVTFLTPPCYIVSRGSAVLETSGLQCGVRAPQGIGENISGVRKAIYIYIYIYILLRDMHYESQIKVRYKRTRREDIRFRSVISLSHMILPLFFY